MKHIFTFIALITLLFSCVKEKDYPTTFQYDLDKKGILNVDSYTGILTDSNLIIEGENSTGILKIHIPVEPGKPLQVRKFETDTLINFYIEFTSKTTLSVDRAVLANLDLTHVNSFANFTFDAVFANGSVIENGVGENVNFKTDDNINNVDTAQTPIFELSNLDLKSDEFHCELQGGSIINVPSAMALPTVMANSTKYTIINGGYQIELELMHPINALIGKQINLTQATQTFVKMEWKSTTSSEKYSFTEGVFYIFNYDETAGKMTFGFNGKLISSLSGVTTDIYVGYGKNILTK